ncbi:MAG: superoxide dismutase [Ni] [Sedimentisphaerales bacterium]
MRNSIKKRIVTVSIIAVVAILASIAYSHCQIPCGIYDDEARFGDIAEHITTIEKSMKEIERLSTEAKPNMNQIVRWVNNKELHADELSEIVTYYFMAQRVKLPAEGNTTAQNEYVKKLTLLHQMLVYSMKAKQTTDLANVEKLKSSLNEFHKAYFGESG